VARPQPIVAPAFVAPEIEDDFDVIEESTPEVSHVQVDPYETPLEVNFDDEELLEEIEEIPETPDVEEQIQTDEEFDDMLDVGDLTFDEEEVPEPEHHMHETTQVANESFDNGYVYDPHVASNELGLPLDLIEEFIQDFIAQAKEFKADIYTALDHAEYEQVKILSHKLKGVAANLRIEDAFNSLSVVNTAEDSNIIRKNLDTFYKIIAKLAGEDIVVEKQLLVEDDDEEIAVDFKEESVESAEITPEVTLPDENLEEEDDLYGDLLDIEDSQVPEKIEIAELADDDYLGSDVNLNTIESEIDEIENIDLLELDKEIEESDDEPLKLELEEEIELETPSFIEEEVALPVIEYSKEKVAGEIGLDVESFNELFEDYISESGIIISEIKSALENHDYSACKHEAMKLKGMSDNMRINSFTHEVETLMRSNDEEETNQAIQKIEIIISEISKIGA
jgi:HPt (histidine-containing phosphotransfer) domain-containing protein